MNTVRMAFVGVVCLLGLFTDARAQEAPVRIQGVLAWSTVHTRTLTGDTLHVWHLDDVEPGTYIEVAVVQRGVDAGVFVSSPDSLIYTYADWPAGPAATQYVRWVADQPGRWQVGLAATGAFAEGSYTITAQAQHPADEDLYAVVRFDSLFYQASRLVGDEQYDEAAAHLHALADATERTAAPDDLRGALIESALAWLAYRRGAYEDAAARYEAVLDAQEQVFGAEASERAMAMQLLAGVYQAQGEEERAQALYHQALILQEEGLQRWLDQEQGREAEAEGRFERARVIQQQARHPGLFSHDAVLSGPALLYQMQGRYEEAAVVLEELLAQQEALLGSSHPTLAFTLNNLAWQYQMLGQVDRAEPLYRRSLEIHEHAWGRDHWFLASPLANMARLYQAQERYAEAEEAFTRALSIQERALGAEHLQVASTLARGAWLYHQQERYAEAETWYRRALAIQEAALGPEHPALAQSLRGLGSLAYTQGDKAEAVTLFERVVAIQEAALEPGHPDLLGDLDILANVYEVLEQWDEAGTLYQRILAVQEQTSGVGPLGRAETLQRLAWVHQVQGRYDEAEGLYRRALALQEEALGAQHPDLVPVLTSLGDLYLAQTRFADAEAVLARVVTILEATGESSPELAEGLLHLASFYHRQERYEEAAPRYARAQTMLEEILGPDHVDVADVLNQRAVLLLDRGQLEEAEALLNRARTIQVPSNHPGLVSTLNNLAEAHRAQGRYREAVPLLEQAIAWGEQHEATDEARHLIAYNNLAGLYQELSRYAAADSLYRQARHLWAEQQASDSLLLATLDHNYAELLVKRGQYAAAESLYVRVLERRTRRLPPGHSDLANVRNSLAGLYGELGRYAAADSLYVLSLAALQAGNTSHPLAETVLHNQAALAHGQGHYAEAEALYRRVLDYRRASLGEEHPGYARTLSNLALVYYDQGRYALADSLFRQSLAIQEAVWGPDHPDLATTLDVWALLQHELGQYAEAEALLDRAMALRSRAFGTDHPALATTLNNLALLYDDLGRITEADSLYHRAYRLTEQALGPEHPDMAVMLNNLGAFYMSQGRYAEVDRLYERSLAVTQQVYGLQHPEVAGVLSNQAKLYIEMGRFGEALQKIERAMAITQQAVGAAHRRMGVQYVNRATWHEAQGQYAEAEWWYEQARNMLADVLGRDHPESLTVLDNLAGLYTAQGRYEESAALLGEVLAARIELLGATHPSVAETQNDLAVVYVYQERFDEAESLLHAALAAYPEDYKHSTLTYATGLNNLGFLAVEQGRYSEADSLFAQALAMHERMLGGQHPAVTYTLIGLTTSALEEGRMADARAAIDRAIAVLDATRGYDPSARAAAYARRARIHHHEGRLLTAIDDLEQAIATAEMLRPLVGGGAEARALFFEPYAKYYDRMVGWQLQAGSFEQAFAYAERGRARALLDQLHAGQVASLPPDLEDRLARARAQLAAWQQRLTWAAADSDVPEVERQRRLAAWADSLEQTDQTYREVYRTVQNARASSAAAGVLSVSLADVQRLHVPQGGMMLLYELGHETSYLFVIPPVGESVSVVPLEAGDEPSDRLGLPTGAVQSQSLSEAVAQLIADIASTGGRMRAPGGEDAQGGEAGNTDVVPGRKAATVPDRLHALWQLLVPEAVRPRLAEAVEVVIVPDGGLYYLPFEALIVQPGETMGAEQYWLDDGPVIRYAPSATMLQALAQRPPGRRASASGPRVLSLSDPVYDLAAVAGIAATSGAEAQDAPAGRTRGAPIVFERPFEALPNTALETEAIEEAFGEEASYTVDVLQGLEASEARLRAALPGKRYIHLATHGWVDHQRGALFASLVMTPPARETDDLANDGFLQLHELYDLHLPEAELAVLAACESNVGANVEGEGVFALSRGFFAAGVRRVIASQWAVNDASSAALIGAFFEGVVAAERRGQPVDFARALHEAKQQLRAHEDWQAPYFWAPFILTGQE